MVPVDNCARAIDANAIAKISFVATEAGALDPLMLRATFLPLYGHCNLLSPLGIKYDSHGMLNRPWAVPPNTQR